MYCIWSFLLCYNIEKKNGRPISLIRNSIFLPHFRDWFPCHIIYEDNFTIDTTKTYVVAMHPHGYIGISHIYNILLNPTVLYNLPLRIITVGINFLVPIWRDLIMSYGVVHSSYKSCKYTLEHNTSIGIVVGGAAESLYTGTNDTTLILKRHGFIRLALETNSDIIPIFSFGENQLYKQTFLQKSIINHIQKYMIRIFGFTIPFVYGSPTSLFLLPYRQPITTIVGKPIYVTKITNPTQQDIENLHTIYCKKLKELFYKYQNIAGDNSTLIIKSI